MDLNQKTLILRKIPSGLYIVSAMQNESPSAAVVSFLIQSSINPPLISMALREGSDIYNAVKNSKKCAIHFPAKDQQQLVASFFKIKVKDSEQINSFKYIVSDLGNPLLEDIQMILEAEVREESSIGDHNIFICEVMETILREEKEALLMSDTNWKYGG